MLKFDKLLCKNQSKPVEVSVAAKLQLPFHGEDVEKILGHVRWHFLYEFAFEHPQHREARMGKVSDSFILSCDAGLELRLDGLGMNRANRSGEFIDEVLIVLDLSAKVVERLSIFLPRLALFLLFNPHFAVSFDDIRDRVPMEDSLQVPQLVSPEHNLHLLDQVRGPAVELKLLP